MHGPRYKTQAGRRLPIMSHRVYPFDAPIVDLMESSTLDFPSSGLYPSY
jgi:hypothetical protein